MIALVPFMYSIFQHEMRILIEGKKSTFKAEKRPRALRQEKPSEEAPGMGLSYMYNPGGKFRIWRSMTLAVIVRGADSLWGTVRGRQVGTSPMGTYTRERSGTDDLDRTGTRWRWGGPKDSTDVVQVPESVFFFETLFERGWRDGQLGRLVDVGDSTCLSYGFRDHVWDW
jgi:hypothetical protein